MGPVHTGTQSFHFLPYCSEKWNSEGLHSDGNASYRTVLFQKNGTTKKVIRLVELYAIAPFRSRLNRHMENMSMEQLGSHLSTKQNWYAIVLFPWEQPICTFQKLERRWNGTNVFLCEVGIKADLHYNRFDRRPKRSNGLRTCDEFWVIAEKSN